MKRRRTLQVASTALAIGFGQACEPRVVSDQDADPDLNDAQARLVEESSVVLADPSTGYLNGVNGATFLGGKIVVAEAGEHRIVAFSVDGELLWEAGRHGSGPGEFESISAIATVGDHVLVYDHRNYRVSEFDGSGTLVSTKAIDVATVALGTSGIIATGGVFFSDGRIAIALQAFPVAVESPRIKRTQYTYAVFDQDGEFTRYAASVQGGESYAAPFGRAGESTTSFPFAKRPGVVAIENQLVVSEGNSSELRYIDVDTGDESVSNSTALPVLQEITKQFWDAAAASRYEAALKVVPRELLPTHLPPYGWMGARPVTPLVASQDGDVWSALVTAPGEGAVWNVIGENGSYVVTSEQPRELLAVGGGFSVTKQYDDLDVETIEVLRIDTNTTRPTTPVGTHAQQKKEGNVFR